MNEIYVCTCVMRSAASDTEREGHDEKMENPWRGALADLEDDLITSNAVLRAYRWNTQPPRTHEHARRVRLLTMGVNIYVRSIRALARSNSTSNFVIFAISLKFQGCLSQSPGG